jgi:hypothetical protein
MREFYLIPLWASARGGGDPDAILAIDRFPCVIGRHTGCDRRVHNPLVSRRHCLFSLRDGRAWVEDLGSLNGTFLNREPVHEPCPLAEGDRLDIAGLPFLCLSRLPEEAEAVGGALSVAGT